jgi:hypothetical protein
MARVPLFSLKPTQEEIETGVEKYFEENPGTGEEPQLAAHLADPTPHPVYDNLAAGRFVTMLQNGMA